MRLEKWALLAEIVSALAIVISLIFVGVQVRQGNDETAANSRALEASVRESMLNVDLTFLQTQLQLPHIYTLRAEGIYPTDPDDAVQVLLLTYMLIRSRENYWNQHASGMLDDDTYRSYRENLLLTLEGSTFSRESWDDFKYSLVPGFVAEIDDELARRRRVASSQ